MIYLLYEKTYPLLYIYIYMYIQYIDALFEMACQCRGRGHLHLASLGTGHGLSNLLVGSGPAGAFLASKYRTQIGKPQGNHRKTIGIFNWLVLTGTMEWIMTFQIGNGMSSSQLTFTPFIGGIDTTNQIEPSASSCLQLPLGD